MRYIADSSGYVKEVSFGADIACAGQSCTEYKGGVPAGYASLEAWYCSEVEKLYRWKIVSGNLTLDSSAVAPSERSNRAVASATGTVETLALAAGTITKVALGYWVVLTDGAFRLSNGGIVCPYDGVVQLHAQVYIQGADLTTRTGAYIFRNDEEVSGNYSLASSAPSTSRFLTVSKGDIIYLKMRAAKASTGYPTSAATHLDVTYV